AQNVLFSGTRLLTFGYTIAYYDHILELSQDSNSILYKRDVQNVDCQDDGAAYRLFCSSFLKQISDQNFYVDKTKMRFGYKFSIFFN
ncbi:7069_t:CDS:1, partial [Racocetra persica]